MEKPVTADPIEKYRQEIDAVDSQLLQLIVKRLELARAVRDAKSGALIWRPEREAAQMERLTTLTDAPADFVSRIWAELVGASLAIQGPIQLHVALEGDALDLWTLVRDRFGASISARAYPTASAALAACADDFQGVGILPAPGGMNAWWSALRPQGALSEHRILAGLPRIGDSDWPRAVAVGRSPWIASVHVRSLIAIERGSADTISSLGNAQLRAEADQIHLYEIDGFVADDDQRLLDIGANCLGGYVPAAIVEGEP